MKDLSRRLSIFVVGGDDFGRLETRSNLTERFPDFNVEVLDSSPDPAGTLRGTQRHLPGGSRTDRLGPLLDAAIERSSSTIFVLIEGGAVPASSLWLEQLVQPLRCEVAAAVTQGAIWLKASGGMAVAAGPRELASRFAAISVARAYGARTGRSLLPFANTAFRRDVWEQQRFGAVDSLAGLMWQRAISLAGWPVVGRPTESTAVIVGCSDLFPGVAGAAREGYEWALLEERFTVGQMLRDVRATLGRGPREEKLGGSRRRLEAVRRTFAAWRGNRVRRWVR